MTDKDMKAGNLLLISSGTYSSYGVTGFFVALQTFNPKALLSEYLAAKPEQTIEYQFDESAFVAHLISKGLLLEIDYATLHTGDYSTHTEVEFHE